MSARFSILKGDKMAASAGPTHKYCVYIDVEKRIIGELDFIDMSSMK